MSEETKKTPSSPKPTDDDVFALFQATKSKPSTSQQTLLPVNAVLTTAVPIYLYWAVFGLSLEQHAIVVAIITVLSAFLLNMAYANHASGSVDRLTHQRQEAVTRQAVDAEARAKAVKHDDIIRKRRAEIAARTATETAAYSVVYNNAIFLLATAFLSYYVFRNLPTQYGYILSVLLSAALTTVNSTSNK